MSYYHPHFAGMHIAAQRGKMTCLRSHSGDVTAPEACAACVYVRVCALRVRGIMGEAVCDGVYGA